MKTIFKILLFLVFFTPSVVAQKYAPATNATVSVENAKPTVYGTPVINVLVSGNSLGLRNRFVQDTTQDFYFIDAVGVSTLVKPRETVETVNDLQTTKTKAKTLVLTDSLRGGTFRLRTAAGNTIDNIIVFSSNINGYVWVRDISNSTLININWGGADASGNIECTSIIQSLVVSGKGVFIPQGTYKTNTIYTRSNTVIKGAGMSKAFLTPLTPNGTLFQQDTTVNGVSDNLILSDFTVKAHPTGSTGSAIKTSGSRNGKYFNIEYLDNGTGYYNKLFDISAAPYLCYNLTFDKIRVSDQPYIKKVFYFNNNNTNFFGNANIGIIRDAWVVNCIGIDTIIEAARSAKFVVQTGLFEGNTNAVAINAGQAMTIQDCWFELNRLDITYKAVQGSLGNAGTVLGNYFSNAHNVDFVDVLQNTWLNNVEAGTQTFINAPAYNSNIKINAKTNTRLSGSQTLAAGTAINAGSYVSITATVFGSTTSSILISWKPDIALPNGVILAYWKANAGETVTLYFTATANTTIASNTVITCYMN